MRNVRPARKQGEVIPARLVLSSFSMNKAKFSILKKMGQNYDIVIRTNREESTYETMVYQNI